MSTNNQATTRGPRLNALADQFRQHRKDLITKVKDLRAQRAALRGVKGSSKQWAALSEEIDSVQNQIDKLSISLGIPVKPQVVIVSPKPVHNPSWDKQLGNILPADNKAIAKAVSDCSGVRPSKLTIGKEDYVWTSPVPPTKPGSPNLEIKGVHLKSSKMENKGNELPTRSDRIPSKDCHIFAELVMDSYAEPVNKMVMDDKDRDAWDKLQDSEDDYQSSPEDFK